MKTISLSAHIGTDRKVLEELGIYDITLGMDTPLFIDPKLVSESLIPEFIDSRINIIKYFSDIIRLLKISGKSDRMRKELTKRLATKEPIGLSIGYGNKTDKGTSIPKPVA
ncbi:MAG: hypothetical protein KDK45_23325, partial [Leptospiraceae bacterium]|nr:hypothetical protein [Leptospiraceae bacterium]